MPKALIAAVAAQQRVADGVVGDGEVLDGDDFEDAQQIEEAHRADAAKAHVADAVAVDGDVDKRAAGDDRGAGMPVVDESGRLQGCRWWSKGLRATVRMPMVCAGFEAVAVDDGVIAQRDAVEAAALDLVFADQDIAGRAGDHDAAEDDLAQAGGDHDVPTIQCLRLGPGGLLAAARQLSDSQVVGDGDRATTRGSLRRRTGCRRRCGRSACSMPLT